MTDPATLTAEDGTPYLAVDVQPDVVENIFTLGYSQLNGPDVLARSATWTGLWENVVCDVQSVSYRRGVARLAGLLSAAEAGTATVIVSDTVRQFDPMANADTIHKGTPLRIRAWGYQPVTVTEDGEEYTSEEHWEAVLWTGEVDQLEATYHPEDPPTVLITGVDLIAVLSGWEAEGRDTLVGAGDTLRQRVTRVLAEVQRGSIAPGSDSTFAATLAPIPIARPWQELSAGVTAELGRLWVDSANRLAVRARGRGLDGTVRGTLSDVHPETEAGAHCCVQDATVVYGWETAGNRALATRRLLAGEDPDTAVLARRDHVPSQGRYGVGTIREDGLDLETDAQLVPWAQAVIAAHAKPRLRVDRVVPCPSPGPPPGSLDDVLTAWPAVCATDIGDRWLFRYRPHMGPMVARTIGVLGVEMEATPDGPWTVVWTTTEAPDPA